MPKERIKCEKVEKLCSSTLNLIRLTDSPLCGKVLLIPLTRQDIFDFRKLVFKSSWRLYPISAKLHLLATYVFLAELASS